MVSYPSRNPFPAQSTASTEPMRDPALLEWARRTPTAPLPAVRRLTALCDDYMRSFDERPRGALAWVYGMNGSGKTHAAMYARARNAAMGSGAPVQLYVKLQDIDFVEAYRKLMSQVDRGQLHELSLRYLGAVAGDEVWHDYDEQAAAAIRSAVRQRPETLRTMFETHVVESGAVLQAQASEMAQVTSARAVVQFQRALAFLDRPALSDAAYAWLCGQTVDDAKMRALGVTEPIADDLMCQYGLQLLCTMVTRAGQPFVLVLDQGEKYLLEENHLVTRNAGFIQELAEAIPRRNGMLVLLTTPTAWAEVQPDLRQRFAPDTVRVDPLTPPEAELVVRVYLRKARDDQSDSMEPFTAAAVKDLVHRSGGNIRALLQMGWACFQHANHTRAEIGTELVEQVPRLPPPLGHLEAAKLMDEALYAAGLDVGMLRDGEPRPAFAVPSATHPSWIIRVTDAVFIDDEAEQAIELLRARRKDAAGVRQVLVIAGYASPDVLDVLRAAASEVLVADDPDAFKARARTLANTIADGFRPAHSLADLESRELGQSIQELALKLDRLQSSRRSELAELRHEIGAALQGGTGAPNWSALRHEIEVRIARERTERAASEVRQFLAHRAESWRATRTRMLLTAGALGLAALPLLLSLMTGFRPPISAVIAGSVLALAAAAIVVLSRTVVGERARRYSQPLSSRADIEDAARRLPPHRKALRDPDALVRLAAAMTRLPETEVVAALAAEPVDIVRQVLARQLAASDTVEVDVPAIDGRIRDGVKEFACLLDRSPSRMPSLNPWIQAVTTATSEQLRILAALRLRQDPAFGSRWLEDAPADAGPDDTVILRVLGLGPDGARDPLAKAFDDGLTASAVRTEPESALRQAAHLVSPFDPAGLGTWDFLGVIPEVDSLYLFLEQAAFIRGSAA
ncbi:hypothetical protein [Dactylosporangium sp. NPDC000521]|uniref:hypothetical protein n=1 Tax=Dactylosporangium sp. NPDC000521 TaxID=3363975 RepID=UPI0036A7FF85